MSALYTLQNVKRLDALYIYIVVVVNQLLNITVCHVSNTRHKTLEALYSNLV